MIAKYTRNMPHNREENGPENAGRTTVPGTDETGRDGVPVFRAAMAPVEIAPEVMRLAADFAASLAGKMTPEQARDRMRRLLEALPPGAPVDAITQELYAGFFRWIADGEPPFPAEGLTVEQVFGGQGPPEEGLYHESSTEVQTMLDGLARSLTGELTPDQVRALMHDLLLALPPDAPTGCILLHLQNIFAEWISDGALEFPEDGMTVEELFGANLASSFTPDCESPDIVPLPPHPEGFVNPFIQPLYDGSDGQHGDGPSWGLTFGKPAATRGEWVLPIPVRAVDLESSTITVDAAMVGATAWVPPGTRDNGDGTYTIRVWPIRELMDNGDGTITLNVDIGPMSRFCLI